MSRKSQPTVRSRQVAARMRELREHAQLSCTEVARTLGLSISKVSRMETAHSGMRVEDVAAMLGLYRVPANQRQEILDTLRRADEKGWWQRQAGLPQLWRSLIEFESKATRIQNFETVVIPGLLQTAEYSKAVIRGTDSTLSDPDVDHLVATRLARQGVLTRSGGPQFVAVMDETALSRPVGDDGVMHRQMLHLGALFEQPNVSLRVVQSSTGAYIGLRGPFVIFEFSEEPALVHVENQSTGMFLEEFADLSAYRLALNSILSVALKPDESAELVRQIAADTSHGRSRV